MTHSKHTFLVLCAAVLTASCVHSLPYRAVPAVSRLMTSLRNRQTQNVPSIEDLVGNYASSFHHHQIPLTHSLPEYEPTYQQGYVAFRPKRISQEELAALIPYLSGTENDYPSYDYEAPSYNEGESVFMEGPATPTAEESTDRALNNHDLALIQLYLDHLYGRYSLEDLETIERQAALEANTEDQLHSLRPYKKSTMPVLGGRPQARPFQGVRAVNGQKEEPIVVPSSPVRTPTFVTSANADKSAYKPTEDVTRSSNDVSISSSKDSATASQATSTSTSSTELPRRDGTTMIPYVKSAYEALKRYLDREREYRQKSDESSHAQHKRFISSPQSLTEQLTSLKKSRV